MNSDIFSEFLQQEQLLQQQSPKKTENSPSNIESQKIALALSKKFASATPPIYLLQKIHQNIASTDEKNISPIITSIPFIFIIVPG